MVEIVSIVFKGLADIPDVPMTPTTARSLADLVHSPRLQVSPDSHQGPLLNPFTDSAGKFSYLTYILLFHILVHRRASVTGGRLLEQFTNSTGTSFFLL